MYKRQEYNDILNSMQREIGDEDYIRYLDAISAHDTHAGYFSVVSQIYINQLRTALNVGFGKDNTTTTGHLILSVLQASTAG